MLAFSSAERLETGFFKMWVVSLRIRSVGYLENGTKFCSEDYCLLGCDAIAVC